MVERAMAVAEVIRPTPLVAPVSLRLAPEAPLAQGDWTPPLVRVSPPLNSSFGQFATAESAAGDILVLAQNTHATTDLFSTMQSGAADVLGLFQADNSTKEADSKTSAEDFLPKDIYGPDGKTEWPSRKETKPWSAEGGSLHGKPEEVEKLPAIDAGATPESATEKSPAECNKVYYFHMSKFRSHQLCEDCGEEVDTDIPAPDKWDEKPDPGKLTDDAERAKLVDAQNKVLAKCLRNAPKNGLTADSMFQDVGQRLRNGTLGFTVGDRRHFEIEVALAVESFRCGKSADGGACNKKKVDILLWRCDAKSLRRTSELEVFPTTFTKEVVVNGQKERRLAIKTRACIMFKLNWTLIYSVSCFA